MLFEIIELFADIISILIVGGLGIWGMLQIFKSKAKRNYDKKLLKSIKETEDKFKSILGSLVGGILTFVKIMLCVILAIGSKNMIYVLNEPLGEGYAIFASYVVAICLYILLPNFNKK